MTLLKPFPPMHIEKCQGRTKHINKQFLSKIKQITNAGIGNRKTKRNGTQQKRQSDPCKSEGLICWARKKQTLSKAFCIRLVDNKTHRNFVRGKKLPVCVGKI